MFAKKFRFWLFFIFLMAVYVPASDGGIVAVLEVVVSEDTEDDSKALELTVPQTKFLTDELRKQAVLALAKTYTILTREKIIELSVLVPENTANVVDIGRAIKSDYVTRSSISSLGNLLVFTIELYSCENGLLLADFTETAPDIGGLLKVIRENSPALFKKIILPESIPTNIPAHEAKAKSTNWLAIGLEVLGAGAIGFGLSQFAAGNSYYDKYKDNYYTKAERNAAYEDAKNAKSLSEISYIVGGVLLASGITIHILF
jgi:hypothetical protein